MRVGLVVVALCLVGMGTVALRPTGIESDSYFLRDRKGAIRGTWGIAAGSTKSTGIWINDEVGRKRLFLGINVAGQPGIYLYDESEDIRWFKQLDAPQAAIGPPATSKVTWWPGDKVRVYFHKSTPKHFHDRALHPGGKKCSKLPNDYLEIMYVDVARGKGLLPCPHCYAKCYQ